MTEDQLDYAQLVDHAMQGVMREALKIVATSGLPGTHHFYLTIRTTHPDLEIDDKLRARYPEEITIVLENQFWDLLVEEDRFSVTLSFGGAPQRLVVPFDAVSAFVDPSVKFGLQFSGSESAEATEMPVPEAKAPDNSEEQADDAAPEEKSGDKSDAEIVTLDNFRKKE